MEHGGLSFPEAVRKLANDLGVNLPEIKYPKSQIQERDKKTRYYQLNKAAMLFFKDQLKKSKQAQLFLQNRQLSKEMVVKYHIGFAPDSWQGLTDTFRRKGVPMNELSEIGLIVSKQGSQRYYDRFRGRVIFPLLDQSQRVLGFGGRAIDSEAQPKYLNSSDSPVYHKSRELYGLSQITQRVQSAGAGIFESGVIFVEGYFDCLMLKQAGFKSVVATMGTALTPEHIDRLKRFTDRFYLLFDGDEAGQNAMARTFPIFMAAGLIPNVVTLPPDVDPDDFINKHSAQALVQKIKSAPSMVDFVLSRLMKQHGRSAQAKAKIIEEFAPQLDKLPDGIEREEMLKKSADLIGVDEKWIQKAFKASSGREEVDAAHWKVDLHREESSAEIELVEFFMLFPAWLSEAKAEKILDLFSDLEVKTIVSALMSRMASNADFSVPAILEKVRSRSLKRMLSQGLIQKENQNWDSEKWRPVYNGVIRNLRKKQLEAQEKKLLMKIKACEKNQTDEAQRVKLLNQYQDVVKKKQSLMNSAV